MLHNLKPYPAYKDSGVPWLGEVPEHWDVKRQRNIAQILVSNIDKHSSEYEKPVRLCNYVDVYKNERITEHIPFMRATASLEEIKKFRLRVGDVVITKDSEMWNDIGVPALIEYEASDLVCGYHLAILRPRDDVIIGPYFLRALQSQGVESQYYVSANGVTRYGLSYNAIKDVLVPIPPIIEQSSIVRYLDYIDRRIRRYIRTKQKLIKLLEEQKQAIIHQAVTRGLDSDVKMKDSGVEWIGEIPDHWEIKRLKRVIVGKLKYGANESAELEDQELPRYIRITDFDKNGKLKEDTFKSLPIELAKDYLLNQGDILFARSGATVGKTFQFKNYSKKACFAGYLIKASPDEKKILSDYFYLYTKSNFYEQWKNSIFIQATIQNISADKYQSLELTVPPLPEQQLIVDSLDRKNEKIDTLIYKASCQIGELREYRTRLIADIVTGKLDVREVAANLPEETDEKESFEDSLAEDDELENNEIEDEQAGELEEEVPA